MEELCEEIFVDVRRWREAKEPYKGASTVTKDLLKHWASRERFRRLFFRQREAVETIIYLHEMLIPGPQRSTGFGDFKLTDTDVKQLLRGERPDFSKRVLIVNAELSLR